MGVGWFCLREGDWDGTAEEIERGLLGGGWEGEFLGGGPVRERDGVSGEGGEVVEEGGEAVSWCPGGGGAC